MYWSLMAITLISSDVDNTHYNYHHIETFDTRLDCEVARSIFYKLYVVPPNVDVRCIKTDEV